MSKKGWKRSPVLLPLAANHLSKLSISLCVCDSVFQNSNALLGKQMFYCLRTKLELSLPESWDGWCPNVVILMFNAWMSNPKCWVSAARFLWVEEMHAKRWRKEFIWVNSKEWLKYYSNIKWLKNKLKLTSKLNVLESLEKGTLKYRKENSWANDKGHQLSQLLGLSSSSNELVRAVKNTVTAGIKITELAREFLWV